MALERFVLDFVSTSSNIHSIVMSSDVDRLLDESIAHVTTSPWYLTLLKRWLLGH